jgi:hypothetical protein
MKPAPQIAGERLATTRWHHGAGEWQAPSAISNPPRFRGKPMLGRLARDVGLAPAARQRMTAPERTAADDAAIFSTDA